MITRSQIQQKLSTAVDDQTKIAFADFILINSIEPVDALWLFFTIRTELYPIIDDDDDLTSVIIAWEINKRQELCQYLYDTCKQDTYILDKFIKLDIDYLFNDIPIDEFIGEL